MTVDLASGDVTFQGGFIDEEHGVYNSEAPVADDVKIGNRVVAFYKWSATVAAESFPAPTGSLLERNVISLFIMAMTGLVVGWRINTGVADAALGPDQPQLAVPDRVAVGDLTGHSGCFFGGSRSAHLLERHGFADHHLGHPGRTQIHGGISLHHDHNVTKRRDVGTAGRRNVLQRSHDIEIDTILGILNGVLLRSSPVDDGGDAVRLESVFDYEVTGDVSNWTIDLKPKSRRIGKHLSSLHVVGNSNGVSRILISLRDGEWHVMSIRQEVSTL